MHSWLRTTISSLAVNGKGAFHCFSDEACALSFHRLENGYFKINAAASIQQLPGTSWLSLLPSSVSAEVWRCSVSHVPAGRRCNQRLEKQWIEGNPSGPRGPSPAVWSGLQRVSGVFLWVSALTANMHTGRITRLLWRALTSADEKQKKKIY